jgi:hypothetical protein
MRIKAAIYRAASRSTPFLQKPVAYFTNDSYSGLDPIFDVLVENSSHKDIIIVGLGIEICSVAHVMQSMGSPSARKIESLGDYQVEIPNINARMIQKGAWRDGRVLETQRVNIKVGVDPFPDRISLEAGGHLRYTLQLNGYVRNVPTQSIIRLFVQTSRNTLLWSKFIRLTHIGADE